MGTEDKVQEAFAKLKKKDSSYELKIISDHYYVYLSYGVRDRAMGKTRKVSIYQGKITKEGVFIESRRKHKVEFEDQEETRQAAGATSQDLKIRESSLKYEKTLLTALSMNGRISLPALGKMLGLSVNATAWQVKSIVRRYGIRYIPEINVRKFGYIQFMITVKFLSSVPPIDKLKSVASAEPRVQLAMLTGGEFDLVIYALARNVEEATDMIVNLRSGLSTYDSTWNSIPIYDDYGFIPLREKFIELMKESGALLDREYAILKELSRDASIEFSKIDKKYGFDGGRSSYNYYRLRSEGKIRRVTITMQKLPMKYVGIILENIVNKSKFIAHRTASLSNIINETKMPTDKYLSVYDTTTPDGSIFFVPVFEYDELDRTIRGDTEPGPWSEADDVDSIKRAVRGAVLQEVRQRVFFAATDT